MRVPCDNNFFFFALLGPSPDFDFGLSPYLNPYASVNSKSNKKTERYFINKYRNNKWVKERNLCNVESYG